MHWQRQFALSERIDFKFAVINLSIEIKSWIQQINQIFVYMEEHRETIFECSFEIRGDLWKRSLSDNFFETSRDIGKRFFGNYFLQGMCGHKGTILG